MPYKRRGGDRIGPNAAISGATRKGTKKEGHTVSTRMNGDGGEERYGQQVVCGRGYVGHQIGTDQRAIRTGIKKKHTRPSNTPTMRNA